jgi:iron complex transport system ATP-binding protein
VLDGRDLTAFSTKELARTLGLLPQTSIAPDGIRVADLVARGRFLHQGAFDRWSLRDEEAVAAAMDATGVTELSGRLVDEPTTFLDIAHQRAALELFSELNRAEGHTLVAVLHDLNQAARYATHVIAMCEGRSWRAVRHAR